MIKITVLSGPHAGKTREAASTTPPEILLDLMEHGWEWQVDYSAATAGETFAWFRIDLTARIVRALMNERPVEFNGAVYAVSAEQGWEQVAQTVEDTVAESGLIIALEYDDERGIKIAIVGREQ